MSLVTNLTDLATRVATETKAIRTLVNGNAVDLSSLTTTDKTNLVAAINEIQGAISGAGASINDTGTSTSSVWSSDKTDAEIDAAIAALVDSAPATLDTLNELAAALGNDDNFATTMTNALSGKAATVHNHVVADVTDITIVGAAVAKAATAGAARTAIGAGTSNVAIGTTSGTAADAALVGDTTKNFVTVFEAGLV